jgi:hypothetical protein
MRMHTQEECRGAHCKCLNCIERGCKNYHNGDHTCPINNATDKVSLPDKTDIPKVADSRPLDKTDDSHDPYTPQADILSEAYDFGHHNKLDGCLVPLLAEMNEIIQAERIKASRELLIALVASYRKEFEIGKSLSVDYILNNIDTRIRRLAELDAPKENI